MLHKKLRIATRESPLALRQAHSIRSSLLLHWPQLQIELIPMSTSGDRFLKDRLIKLGGKGLFVKELEEAMLDGRADIAVHSMKDVPSSFPEGLFLATICKRENPFDAFISKHFSTLDSLPKGAIIGTSSLRRQAQLLTLRPDLNVKSLRGNINTRIAKLETGEFDGIILAAAGLERLKMQKHIKELLTEDKMLPACGQGALGVECRVDDLYVQELLKPLNDPLSALCIHTERQVNASLGGGCHTPVAIYCQPQNEHLLLKAKLVSPDGKKSIKSSQHGLSTEAATLADNCTIELFNLGARELLNNI
jgi:hydroxymethylbilane synthase